MAPFRSACVGRKRFANLNMTKRSRKHVTHTHTHTQCDCGPLMALSSAWSSAEGSGCLLSSISKADVANKPATSAQPDAPACVTKSRATSKPTSATMVLHNAARGKSKPGRSQRMHTQTTKQKLVRQCSASKLTVEKEDWIVESPTSSIGQTHQHRRVGWQTGLHRADPATSHHEEGAVPSTRQTARFRWHRLGWGGSARAHRANDKNARTDSKSQHERRICQQIGLAAHFKLSV